MRAGQRGGSRSARRQPVQDDVAQLAAVRGRRQGGRVRLPPAGGRRPRGGEGEAATVLDGPQSIAFLQAENRMHLAKGLLVWLIENAAGGASAT